MEWRDLVSDEELDLSVKIVTRRKALLFMLDPKVIDRMKWREKRVKIQVSLTPAKKRVRISPAPSGWSLVDRKGKGTEITVRQLLPIARYTRSCAASVEQDALIIVLPDDFELQNAKMVQA